MDYEERITAAELGQGEERSEMTLRPQKLEDYIGQKKATDNLKIFIEAAKLRKEPLDHVLFYGPPGLGKTTLAGIISNEMGVDIRITSGPAIERAGDLAAILTNLNENDVLFIDEIHRLNRSGRGSFVLGDGGFCAGHYYWKRAFGTVNTTGYCKVYADRCNNACRQPFGASKRPFRSELQVRDVYD